MDLNRQQMYEVVSWFLDESSSSEDEELNAVWMSLLESDAEQKPSASPKPKQCKPKEKRANRRDRKSSYPKRKDIDVNSYTEDEVKLIAHAKINYCCTTLYELYSPLWWRNKYI